MLNILAALENFFHTNPEPPTPTQMIDYSPYAPTDGDRQESENPWVETNGCEAFAHVHACEIGVKFWTGQEVDYSEQAQYQFAGVDPQTGSTNAQNIAAIKKYGLVLTSLCPEPVDFTLAEFRAPLDPGKLATGLDFLKNWDVDEVSLAISAIFNPRPAGQIVLLTINVGPDDKGKDVLHEVVLLNKTQYFDSYGVLVKPLSYPIVAANLLTIKPKTMQLVNDKGTFYLVGNLGKVGLADIQTLEIFQKVTSEVQQFDTSNIPQVEVLKQQQVTVQS